VAKTPGSLRQGGTGRGRHWSVQSAVLPCGGDRMHRASLLARGAASVHDGGSKVLEPHASRPSHGRAASRVARTVARSLPRTHCRWLDSIGRYNMPWLVAEAAALRSTHAWVNPGGSWRVRVGPEVVGPVCPVTRRLAPGSCRASSTQGTMVHMRTHLATRSRTPVGLCGCWRGGTGRWQPVEASHQDAPTAESKVSRGGAIY